MNILFRRLALLFIIVANPFVSFSQNSNIFPVTIGQQVPDITLNGLINSNSETLKLSNFRGKLLILDFWATWCSPCIAMIPKMDSLQILYKNKLLFLPITYQSKVDVDNFLERRKIAIGKIDNQPMVVGDKTLSNMFPHASLPHYVWINGEGTVVAITGYEEVNSENIEKLLRTGNLNLDKKSDQRIAYDGELPLIIAGNGGDGHNLLYHTVFTSNTLGLNAGYSISPDDSLRSKKITATNESLLRLYMLAYGEGIRYFGKNRLLLRVKQPELLTTQLKGPPYEDWYRAHSYCYEVMVPPAMSRDAFHIMQHDLELFFSAYQAKVETVKTKCLVLVRTSNMDKLKSAGGKAEVHFDLYSAHLQNTFLNQLTARLGGLYMQNSPIPIIEDAKYNGRVDLNIQANLSSLEAVNTALRQYDLKLEEQEREMEMLVVSDR